MIASAINFGVTMLEMKVGPIVLSIDHIDMILKSFAMYKINEAKYLNNACIIQSTINNNDFVTLNMNNEIIDLLKFAKNNSSIENTNDLATKYITVQKKYQKNKINH